MLGCQTIGENSVERNCNSLVFVDVDECIVGSHDCHPDANCTNSPGSFSCQCKPGFLGDGKNCTRGS